MDCINITALLFGTSVERIGVAAFGSCNNIISITALPFVGENEAWLRDYPRNVFSGLLVYLPSLNAYLNDTDQYDVLGATSHSDRIGLELPSGKLVAIRPHYRFADSEKTEMNIRINPGGSADIEVVRRYYGTFFGRENRRFS